MSAQPAACLPALPTPACTDRTTCTTCTTRTARAAWTAAPTQRRWRAYGACGGWSVSGAASLGWEIGGDFVDYLELREAIIFPAESAHSL
jgi:hypothetical protein